MILLNTQQTITEKMADQGWSHLYVVFTRILCGTNSDIFLAMMFIFKSQLQIASQSPISNPCENH